MKTAIIQSLHFFPSDVNSSGSDSLLLALLSFLLLGLLGTALSYQLAKGRTNA